ncbi:hypothetical protein EJB05_10983, partial [Eragrostis curvula]
MEEMQSEAIYVVDGSLPMETVEEQLRELATNCIQECNGKPLTNLA